MKQAIWTRLSGQLSVPVAWGMSLRDEAPPRVLLEPVAGEIETLLGGPSGFRVSIVQVNVYARSFAEQETLREAVLTALSGWSSAADGIYGVICENADRPAPGGEGISGPVFWTSLDFSVSHRA